MTSIRVALTGGIGSGKSTVAGLLRDHGALVIDADEIARTLVEPGMPALAEIEAEFGSDVIRGDGSLDRQALARIVFDDQVCLAALNRIMHPRIGARTAELLAATPPGSVVVYDMPLLVEQGLTDGWDHVIVVEAPVSLRLQRLESSGRISAADAQARMAAQATDDQRRAVADTVLVNDGNVQELQAAVDAVWQRLTRP